MHDHAAAPSGSPAPAFSRGARLAGWAVHLYTASGAVLGLLTVLAAIEGEVETALWLVLATLFVDGTDGMLARRLRVKETIPWFDGALLDNIVDYLTFTFVAVVLLWTTDRLPDGAVGWVVAALPLLASCYQFCRVDAKTEDHYFLGFPSYWNIVALYAIVLDLGTTAVAVLLVVLTVLVFVPIKYVYPSRTVLLRSLNMGLATAWLVSVVVLLLQYPDPHPVAVALSLAYPVYYTAVSVWLTVAGSGQRAGSAQGGQTAA
ncbi:CDP-alcohol phosphatidyltransferase family protein [Candidatus Blastococcus massiliensis]|uniref:CDP-alcohol phosphatidyltransferase family protein n=1 Tax=Candidatus Blastococcus massiliensis TaxID=1470358 RepID=UPI0004BB2C05|nr:CDP-alcohol phosphatidyltransferase family protein [Candidatus Blastococcus massiliensis]